MLGTEYLVTKEVLMIRLTETAVTSLSREQVFRYVGDFGNVNRWDPGVISAEKATAGDPSVGTAYDLVLSFGDRELKMQYVITEYEAGSKIVLEGSAAKSE